MGGGGALNITSLIFSYILAIRVTVKNSINRTWPLSVQLCASFLMVSEIK